MKFTVIALVLCFAAFVSAAPLEETRGPISDKLHALVVQLNQMLLSSNANPALIAAIQAAIAHIHALHDNHKRGIFDGMANLLGLGEIWNTISGMPAQVIAQVTSVMQALIFVGKDKWTNEILPIIMKLKEDIFNHVGNAQPLIVDAFNQIQAHLSNVIGKREALAFERSSVVNMIISAFGLDKVWAVVQNLGGNIKDQFFLILEKLMFAGTSAFNQAKPIISELVSNLQAHAENAVPLITNAIAQLTGVLSIGKRESERAFIDTVMSIFGINEIWAAVQNMGSNFIETFKNLMTTLMFAGSSAWAQAKPIFAELIQNVHAHIGNAGPLISAAVSQLQAILIQTAGKRDLERGIFDSILSVAENIFGITDLAQTITNLHSDLSDKFFTLIEKLFFMGTQAWGPVKEVLKNLKDKLVGHAEMLVPYLMDAVKELTAILTGLTAGKRDLIAADRGIVQILENIFGLNDIAGMLSNFHGQIKDKFFTLLGQVMLMGQTAFNQAKPVFQNLIAQLQGHAEKLPQLLAEAVAQLTAIVQGHIGKRELAMQRGFLDMIGASSIIQTITGLGSNMLAQFNTIMSNLQNAGLAAWAAAIPVFSNLMTQIKDHAGNAKPLIEAAFQQLQAIVQGHIGGLGKRAAITDFVMNTLGLSQLITLGQAVGENLKAQLMNIIEKLIFSGKDVLAQAKEIIGQLVAQIKEHAENAIPLVQQAILSLTALLPK